MKFISNLFTRFSTAILDEVKIEGAQYEVTDTKDGWYTLKDVLFFAEVPKGEKSAPEDVKAERMGQMVKSATDRYQKEKFAAPAHKGHHKAIAFEDPEFLGFMLPKRVGKTTLDGREQDAVYGDIKLKASAFERLKKGELPYVSPEVDWATWQFSSIAFLDSMPPHFKGPLITVGKVTEDANAKFTVGSSISKGKFMAITDGESEPKETKAKDGNAQMCSKCGAQMGMTTGVQAPATNVFQKPDSSAPKEDNEKGNTVADEKTKVTKFEDDPTAMAKFAAQEARLKAMEDKLTAKETEEAKAARVKAAFAELEGYPLTDAGKSGIAKFADDAEKLKTFIEVLKAQTPKNSPKTVSAFEAGAAVAVNVSGADPDLAEFQIKRPNDMPAILRYAEYFEVWKNSKAAFGASEELTKSRKGFIEIMMKIDPTAKYLDNHKIEGGR